jgi:hypothetical protein
MPLVDGPSESSERSLKCTDKVYKSKTKLQYKLKTKNFSSVTLHRCSGLKKFGEGKPCFKLTPRNINAYLYLI